VGSLWLVGDLGVRRRVLKLLHQKGRSLASLRAVLLEYRANLGDDGEGRYRGTAAAAAAVHSGQRSKRSSVCLPCLEASCWG
jgi:hypothetical protein